MKEKYIDAEKLKAEIKRLDKVSKETMRSPSGVGLEFAFGISAGYADVLKVIDSLQQEQEDMGEVSDGYHTFNELYYYRMLYNAAFFNLLPKEWVHKSKRHHTGEECFGGGWFIVMANLPTGQVSNHYELKDWDLFKVPEKEFADEWDGHTPQQAAKRLHEYLQQEQPELSNNLVDIDAVREDFITEVYRVLDADSTNDRANAIIEAFDSLPTVSREQPEVDLKKEYKEYVEDDPVFSRLTNRNVGLAIARHFYELGLNARKDE